MPEHRLALRESESHRIGEILRARLICVEECAFEFGPEALRPSADRRRANQPGLLRPRREQPLNVVGRHQNIAVGDDDPVARPLSSL